MFENTNLRTDEKLHELSRGIAIGDILPVLNSLVELIADSYKNFSLKREEQ